MNRRSFLTRCLSGAVLGMARVLPMPELPRVRPQIFVGSGSITKEQLDEAIRMVGEMADGPPRGATELWMREMRHYDRIVMDDLESAEFDDERTRAAFALWISMPPCEPS